MLPVLRHKVDEVALKKKNKKIIIDITHGLNSVSLIEDGVLKEYFVEDGKDFHITGNIYKGRVVNVLKGLGCAFVDIGREKNGFLQLQESFDERPDLKEANLQIKPHELKEGDWILVQALKEELGEKGARLTTNISIAGRFTVYLPELDFVGVSKKIPLEEHKIQLAKLLKDNKEPHEGLIARTIAGGLTAKEIVTEIEELRENYAEIKDLYVNTGEKVSLLYGEGNLTLRSVRDILGTDIDSIVVSDARTANFLREHFIKKSSRFAHLVEEYKGNYDILDSFDIVQTIDGLLSKKISLPSGGSIVIEETEALCAVDVNSGSFKSDKGFADTILQVNLEAAKEIVKQIQLRNIGGIIVVDFIDMQSAKDKTAVEKALKEAFSYDRQKTKILPMTGLGLVELTRKKSGSALSQSLLVRCKQCRSDYATQNPLWVARKLKVQLKRLFTDNHFTSAIVMLNSEVIDTIFNTRFFTTECEEIWSKKRIYCVPDKSFSQKNFEIEGSNEVALSLPNNAKLLY